MHYRTLLIVIAVLAWAERVYAADPPEEVKRVIRTFDFEERRLGNVEDVPMHWSKIRGSGFPHYVNGRLSTDTARSGKYSFRFDLNGGSLAYRYASDRIKVMAGAHYRIEVFVRTTTLAHARPRMTAWLADQDGRPIESTLCHQDDIPTSAVAGEWRPLNLELSADDSSAAFLVLELGLLQPAQYGAGTLGQRTLNEQDIRGTAWFDDLTISQVPRLLLSTNQPANLFFRGQPVQLSMRIDDRFTDDLSLQTIVADADGHGVYQRSGTAELAKARQEVPGRKQLPIDLPELPAGWYQASVAVSSQGQTLGTQHLSFVQLADAAPPVRPDGRFGFVATHLPFAAWSELPKILPVLAGGRVKLALWGPQGDVLEEDPIQFDALLEKLAERGIVPTACLIDLPPKLAAKQSGVVRRATVAAQATGSVESSRLNPSRPDDAPRESAAGQSAPSALPPLSTPSSAWAGILDADPKTWQPQLAFLVSRHANHLDRWQLGDDGDGAFASDPLLRRTYDRVYSEFERLVRHPDLAMPWPAWYELDAHAPATVALSIPPNLVLPSQVPLYLNDEPPAVNKSLALRSPHRAVSLSWLDDAVYGRQERLRDLAQRVIYTVSASADRIDMPFPVVSRREQGQLLQEPLEELIVLRTLVTTLSNAKFKGKIPIAEGVEAFCFERDGQGILAMWDKGNAGGLRELAVNLGPSPVMLDLWGNVTPVPKLSEQQRDGRVTLKLSRTPIFLLDIDSQLMQTRASVAFDRPLIESSFQSHERRIHFTNGYDAPITGTLRLKPPSGWEINPPSLSFSLNPGETFDHAVALSLPYNSLAGAKAIEAFFVMGGNGRNDFVVPIPVELGLSDVGMQSIAVRDGKDLIVQQMITNYGDKPADYTAFALFPGQSRQERLVSGLAAGKSVLKRYRFENVQMPPDAKVRIGLKELVGTRILNDELIVR